MGVYADLRKFVLAHRTCAGSRHANAGPPTVDGYRVSAVCGCGAEFKRWVTLDDADEDLLKSALLAFERASPEAMQREHGRRRPAPRQ